MERLQHAAEQIDPRGFSDFLAKNNVRGLRVRQLFTDTITKEHSFHCGHLTGRVLRDGKVVYQALFKDGDEEELTASEVLQNVSNYARANAGGAAASSGGRPRKGRAGKKGRRHWSNPGLRLLFPNGVISGPATGSGRLGGGPDPPASRLPSREGLLNSTCPSASDPATDPAEQQFSPAPTSARPRPFG